MARLAAAFEDGDDRLSQASAVLRAQPDLEELGFYEVDDPADLPLGAADRRLLATYEQVCRDPLEETVRCDRCGALTALPLTTTSVGPHRWVSVRTDAAGGLREPTYADLLASGNDPGLLRRRCRLGGAEGETGADPLADLDGVEQSLAGPLRSQCVECGAPVVVDTDVVDLVLAGLAVVCAEFDRDVHLLASSYGWDLMTIEALPDRRRQRLAALAEGIA
ncbi:MAG: hypothetical protein ABI083_05390 [Lapillicoccus sp.]